MLRRKYGLILVSGPTGSGKSTTLMSMINILNNGQKKIISVEDPVENRVKGIVQVQVNEEIGITFSEILRNALRNDPDIIVISEIRDEITAEIAVRAALTGHLVIATIHTNDSISTVTRLMDMGIPKYLILDALIGVIGQRLTGRKCFHCSGKGCKHCRNGYNGRISINETLMINEEIKNILKSENSSYEYKNKLKKNQSDNFIDFEEDIKEKVTGTVITEIVTNAGVVSVFPAPSLAPNEFLLINLNEISLRQLYSIKEEEGAKTALADKYFLHGEYAHQIKNLPFQVHVKNVKIS